MTTSMLKVLLFGIVVTICEALEHSQVQTKYPIHTENDDSPNKPKCQSKLCETEECVTTAARILDSLDTSTNPCNNFYDFACGGWIEDQIIPSDRFSLLTLYDADKHLAAAKRLLEGKIKPSDLSSVRKAKELYASCTDYATKFKNKSVVNAIKNKFGTWPLTVKEWNEDDFDLEDFLTKALYLGVYPLIQFQVGLTVYVDNGKIFFSHFPKLTKPVFGLPLKSYVDKSDDDLILKIYRQKIYSDAMRFKIEDPEIAMNDALEIVEVEKTLAKMLDNFQNDDDETTVNYTLVELQDHFGQLLDWTHFLTSVMSSPKVGITDFTDSDNVTVDIQEYLVNMTEYFTQLPARTQANYLIWRVLDSLESLLVTEHTKIDSLLKNTVYGITSEPSPEESCINYVSKAFNLVLHRLLYTDKFPPQEIETVYAMLMQIQQEFDVVLDEHDWVDEDTAIVIKEKNAALATTLIYYEKSMNDTLLDEYYANVTVDIKDFIKNVLEEREEAVVRNLRLLRRPYERSVEELPHEMVAQNFFLDNKMEFTSIIFEPPMFISHVPQSLNYGGMGVVFGHEIIHAFDNTGYLFNKEGKQGNWWSNETVSKFEERQQCMIDQYSKFFYTEANDFVNGTLTLPENMGDNGGIKLAYRAYRKYVDALDDDEPQLPGIDFTQDQLFFINFAQVWCKVEKNAAAMFTLKDVHSPHRFRVIGTVQNSEDFSRVFNCPKGSDMNPETKCEVW